VHVCVCVPDSVASVSATAKTTIMHIAVVMNQVFCSVGMRGRLPNSIFLYWPSETFNFFPKTFPCYVGYLPAKPLHLLCSYIKHNCSCINSPDKHTVAV
jgi:hypothetical protein